MIFSRVTFAAELSTKLDYNYIFVINCGHTFFNLLFFSLKLCFLYLEDLVIFCIGSVLNFFIVASLVITRHNDCFCCRIR